jgi:hypothetical protein
MHRRSVVLGFIFALLACASALAQLQTGIIRGRAVDESGQVIPGVTVTLRDVQRGFERFATSGAEGNFQFLAVPPGSDYEILAEISGFATLRLSDVEARPGFTQQLTLEMSIAAIQESVTVVAERPLVDLTTTQESTDIDAEFMETLPLISRNYTEIVPQLPGVSWNRGGRFTFYQFNIHGAEIWGNGYRIDGASNMFSANRAGFLMVPSAIESVEIITGGIPAEYGEQYGGMIKITTKTGTNEVSAFVKSIARPNAFYSSQETGIPTQVLDKPPGSAYFNEFAIGGPIVPDKIWHFGSFQWNHEQQGSVLTLAEPVELDFYSFSEKITWEQNDRSRWDFSFSGSPHWARNRPPDITIAEDAKFTQHTPGMLFALGKHTHIFDDDNFMENSFSYYYLDLFTQTTRGRETIPPDEIRLTAYDPELGFLVTTGAHPTYSQTLNDRFRYSARYYKNTASHTIKTGLDYTEQFGSSPGERYVKTIQDLSTRPQGGQVILSANYVNDASLRDRMIGLFIQDTWSIRGRATFDYGLRYDRESVVGKNNFSPRIGFSIDPMGDGRTKLFTNFGILYSNLNSSFYTFDQTYDLLGLESGITGLGSENPPTFIVLDPDENYDGTLVPRSRLFRSIDGLKNPYALSYSVGVEHQLPMDTKVSVTYNHRDYKDNFKTTSTRLNAIDVTQAQNNTGEAVYDGVEFVVRKYLTERFDLLGHYTLATSEGDTTDPLSPLQQEFSYGPQDWDQRHTVVLISNLRLPYELDSTVVYRYASGRPYSITNDQPDVFAAWVDPEGNPVNRNNERMPSNWTIDLSLSRRFVTGAGAFTPSFEIINLTNHLNITEVSDSFNSAGRPVAADTSRLIQIGIGWQF